MFASPHRLAIATALLAVFAQDPVPRGVAPTDLTRLVVSAPATIQTLDAKALGGTPTRIAWSLDGRQLYVRASRFDRWANETVTHAVVSLDTRQTSTVSAEPVWAMRYWAWKSAPSAPGRDDFAIKLETREELVRTTNVPREGDIGMHTADPTATPDEIVRRAALASQKTLTETLSIRGRIIDRAVNQHVAPGRRFGWAPAPRGLLAFSDEKGRLVLMNSRGETRQVKKTKNVLLPSWSEDGARLAYLEKAGRDAFALRIVGVT